jgi:hypothetical protein
LGRQIWILLVESIHTCSVSDRRFDWSACYTSFLIGVNLCKNKIKNIYSL